MSDKRKIIMDCDPGTDDSVCIVMALTHPDVELLGITTESGNLPADKTTANALRILEYMDRGDIPVAQGMMHPMLREYPKDPYSHGVDGLGNHFFPEPKLKPIDKSPAQFIVDTVLANPGEVTLVCTSCLTNIAIAFMSRPEIMTDVREINVAIDCGGPLTRGMTIWDRRDHFRWEHLPKIRTVFAIDRSTSRPSTRPWAASSERGDSHEGTDPHHSQRGQIRGDRQDRADARRSPPCQVHRGEVPGESPAGQRHPQHLLLHRHLPGQGGLGHGQRHGRRFHEHLLL